MQRSLQNLLIALLLGLAGLPGRPAHAAYSEVEVCFALDTTGSMSGLIEAAKQKIWTIANALVQAPSKPRLRFCLLAYRDRGDEYVTRHTPLTDDIDAVYAALMELQAGGGGDTPEAVNQALLETVQNSGWAPGPNVLKLVFLVGDAPPSVYAGEPQYRQISAMAGAAGILINPVVCGSDQDTLRSFDEIARLGGGRRAQIVETGRIERIPTPMDQDLAALNQRMGRLLVPYGDTTQQEALLEKQRRAERMGDDGLSDRLAYNRATGRIVQGGGDLIEDLDAGRIELAAIPPAALPEQLRSMSEAELHTHLKSLREERESLRRVIGPLIDRREAFVAAKRSGDTDSFDSAVRTILAEQLATR